MQCQLNIILSFSILRYVISFPISVNSEVTVTNISWTNKINKANSETDIENLLQHATWVKPHFPNCWENLNTLLLYNNSLFGKGLCADVCSQMKTSCNMLKNKMIWNSLITCKKKIHEGDCLSKVPLSNSSRCGGALKSYSDISSRDIEWEELNNIGKNKTYGCSLPCDSSLHYHKLNEPTVVVPIIVQGTLAMLVCLFTTASFIIDWKNQRRYPAVILFILNLCYLICFLGWFLQFLGIGNEMSCKKNGKRRVQEPRSLDSIFCIISFILIYFSMISIALWCTVLMYAWNISFKSLSTTKDVISGKVRYFHFIVWFFAVVLTNLALMLQQVEGHVLTGICFVRSTDNSAINWFVISPLVICVILGEFFLASCIRQLYRLRATCFALIIPKAGENISRTIYRLVIYGIVILVATLLPVLCFIHQNKTRKQTKKQYSEYIMCKLNGSRNCNLHYDYRFIYFHIQYTSLVISALACSSWTWTSATLKIWYQTWRRYRTRNQRRSKLNLSWYLRMQKKQISPYVPPVDAKDPLSTKFPPYDLAVLGRRSKRNSDNSILSNLSQRLQSRKSINTRRHSDDIRTVLELFSGRRGSKISIQSVISDGSLKSKRSKSLTSLQSYGHLTAHDLKPSLRRRSSNLTVIQLDNDANIEQQQRRSSDKSLNNFRDDVYTSLSDVHRNNIVADCIPYRSRQNTPS